MPPDSLAARRDRIVARLRRIRVWLLLIVGGVAVALLPWTAYLSATLPSKQLTEHWDRPSLPDGDVATVTDLLGHAVQRRAAVDDQNREAARQVASDLAAVIGDAHEAASQAERGFVEKTGRDHGAVHREEVLAGEPERAVLCLGHPRAQGRSPGTSKRV